jgi:putative ABC transport system substrate-binding protein
MIGTSALLSSLLLFASPAAARESVAILRSDSLASYDAPVEAFRGALGTPVEVFDLQGERAVAQRVAANLRADPPQAIFALGAKAAWIAARELPDVPLIYAMVLDPDRYQLNGTLTTGVRMQPPPDLVLSQLQVMTPNVRRLAIILGQSNNDPMVAEAIQAARNAGYEVRARRVSSEREARMALSRAGTEADAVWLLPDPIVVTPRNFHALQAEALSARIPVLAYSEGLVSAGALLCVAPDLSAVGRSAASLVKRHLAGENIGVIPPEAPEAIRVVLNKATQEAIGLELDASVLSFVDAVVQGPRDR